MDLYTHYFMKTKQNKKTKLVSIFIHVIPSFRAKKGEETGFQNSFNSILKIYWRFQNTLGILVH